MFKRKAEDEGAGREAKIAPIPRSLPMQTITLNFCQRTWETFAPGELYYLPICATPRYMFDPAMINQLNKFKGLWHTMELHTPKVKMSNFVMLQDELRVQAGTPTDSTAFTQVIYMIEYTPTSNNMYFKLGNADNLKADNVTTCTYSIKPEGESQFCKIKNFENFQKLCIMPAQANQQAGFISGQAPSIDTKTKALKCSYIPPNLSSDIRKFCAATSVPNTAEYFVPPNKAPTFARNQDNIKMVQYGDVCEWSPNTNLEGQQLMNDIANDFTTDKTLTVQEDENKVLHTYNGEFIWPGPNRPYFSRHSNLDDDIEPVQHNKDLKKLTHKFWAIAPIKRPNGALLGQRCSFLLEQHFSLTIHASQATFTGDSQDDANMINQKHGIITRPIVYNQPEIKEIKSEPTFICTVGGTPKRGLNSNEKKIFEEVIPNIITFQKEPVAGGAIQGSKLLAEPNTYNGEDFEQHWYKIMKTAAETRADLVYCALNFPSAASNFSINYLGVTFNIDDISITYEGKPATIPTTYMLFNMRHYWSHIECIDRNVTGQKASNDWNVFYA